MSKITSSGLFPAASATVSAPLAIARGIASLPLIWLHRARVRHELAQLAPEQLRDVGLNPETISRESRKPFWIA